MRIKKLSLEDFYQHMTSCLKDNQISLYGFRVNLINKMTNQWGIKSYEDLAKFPFSKLLMSRIDVGFLGNLELQMNLHGLTLNIDAENIPTSGKEWVMSKKLCSFYDWMEEHEDLIHWFDLPEPTKRHKPKNVKYYESEDDYIRDVFRGLVKEKVD